MHRLRRLLTITAVAPAVGFVLACLLVTQAAGLHVHTHNLSDPPSSAVVHVTGAEPHASPHDESGEIELAFDALPLDLPAGGSLPLGTAPAALLLLRAQAQQARPYAHVLPAPRLPAFALRPPAQAPPV